MSALNVLEQAATIALTRGAKAADVLDLLRPLTARSMAAALGDEDPDLVDDLLTQCGALRGCGGVVKTIREQLPVASGGDDRVGAAVMPAFGVPGDASMTQALRRLGYAGELPAAVLIPPGYRVDGSGVWRATPTDADPEKHAHVSAVVIAVVGTASDAEVPGRERLTLAWRYAGRWVEITIAAEHATAARALHAAVGAAGPVLSDGEAGPVAAWIAAQARSGAEVLPRTESLRRCGWLPSMAGYAAGQLRVGAPVVIDAPGDGERGAPYGVEGGELGGWVEHVWSPLAGERGAIAVVAALAPPLIRVVGALHGFVLSLAGESGTGKTTAARAAASAWGPPSGIMQTWPRTAAGARESLAFRGDVLTYFDEGQNVRNDPGKIVDAIYLVGGEQGATLGQQGGGTRAAQTVRTVLLSTSERMLSLQCAGAVGALARLVEVRGSPIRPGSRALVDRIDGAARTHYGHAGPAVVRWLHEHRSEWAQLRERFVAWKAHYEGGAEDQGARLGAHLALMRVASEVAAQAIPGFVVPEQVFVVAQAAVVETGAERDQALAALHHAHGWWSARASQVKRGDSDVIGVSIGYEAQRIAGGSGKERRAWLSEAMGRCLHEAGYAPDMPVQWARRGWVMVDEAGRPRRRVSSQVDKGRPWCIILTEVAENIVCGADESQEEIAF